MRRLGLAYALLMVSVSTQAVQAGTATVTVKDQAGATQTYNVTTDAGGHFAPQSTVCDGVALATCATVGTYGTAPGGVAALNVNAAAMQTGTWNMRLQDAGGNGISSDARGTERPLSVQVLDASGNQIVNFGGPASVSQSGVWNQRLQDGSGNAITSDLRGSARPLSVEILDGSGNQITAFNGGPVTQSGTWNVRLQDTAGNGITSSTRGAQQPLSVQVLDASGNQITSFGGSTSGFPGTQVTGSPITATTSGVVGVLPAGTTVVATNVGTTNAAYCKLGGSASTNDQYIAPNGGWFAFTVGSATQMTCITSTSTTQVNLVGGSGLPTGTGGGSGGGGGGGGGAIGTYGTNPGAVAAQAVNANVTNLVPLGRAANGASTPVTLSTDQLTAAGAPSSTQVMAIQGTPGMTAVNAFITNLNNNGKAISSLSAPVVLSSGQMLAAGSPSSTDVMTVQGVSGGTAVNTAITNLNGNGQALMVNSTPVVIASDQAYLGTSAGWTTKFFAGLSNTATTVKTGGGQLGKLYCSNPNTSFAYIQVFNALTGSITLGSTTPAQSYGIPPTNSAGFSMGLVGDQYGTAISVAVTTTSTGSTAPSIGLDCDVSYN